MDLQLKDKVFLVTAASKGLGFSTAKTLADEGAKVIICGRTESTLQEAVKTIGQNAQFVVADVSSHDDIEHLLAEVENITTKLDGLFVNAGGPPPGTFATITDEDWENTFKLTLMSTVWLTRKFLPLLKKAEHPAILYNTSISIKEPIENLLLSNSMRSAVVGMMRTIASEIGPEGIRVNAICPGYIYTKRVDTLLAHAKTDNLSPKERIESRIPLGRMGTPQEFGAVSAFLLSPVASYIHGALLLVDGGLYRGMM